MISSVVSRLVACLVVCKLPRDGPSRSFPLMLIHEEKVVSYWRKKWELNTGKLPAGGLLRKNVIK